MSGDANPMHLDPLAARRTQAGAPVVHGVHGALWALESAAASGLLGEAIARIDVRFKRFLYVDAAATFSAVRNADGMRLTVTSEGVVATTIDVRFGPSLDGPQAVPGTSPMRGTLVPERLDVPDLPERRGAIAVDVAPGTREAFPSLTRRLGVERVQAIARLSTLVGMVCPGLSSIFDGFSIRIAEGAMTSGLLSFAVTEVDDRFRSLRMAVACNGFVGTVDAFVRHPPIEQPAIAELAARLEPGEFAAASALVVGGSRGIGAATARAIVSGGGRAIVTFNVGAAEAAAIVAEAGAERCAAIPYDVLSDPGTQLKTLPWAVDQMYYFATPQIFRDRDTVFDADRFAAFSRFYLEGFAGLATALATSRAPVTCFFPSSVFVTERPRKMAEYAMAKAAGEVLCEELARTYRGTRFVARRLPKVLTDQTASVIPAETADPFTVMLPIIRDICSPQNRPSASVTARRAQNGAHSRDAADRPA